MGVHGGYYFSALDTYYNGLELTLNTPADSELALAAHSTFRPYSAIVYREDQGYASPCVQNVCYEPIKEPEALKKFLATPTAGT